MGYEQKLKLRVDDNPLPLGAMIDEEFFIPGSESLLNSPSSGRDALQA